jgi:predicted TIM-barrel enzyme
MTIHTLSANQAVDMIEEGDIVNGNWELNVAGVTSARPRVQATCSTANQEQSNC